MTNLYQMELELTRVLAEMEQAGVLVDIDGLETFGKYLSEQMEELQQMVYDEAGHSFKIGSPKQLGDVLFGEQKLPHGKRPRRVTPPMQKFWNPCEKNTRLSTTF